MDGTHCSCCEGNSGSTKRQLEEAERAVVALKADIADLKETNEDLRVEVKELEADKQGLNNEVDLYQDEADDAEKARDDAMEQRDRMHDELREERAKHLEFLRRMEWSHEVWRCPVCKHDWAAAGNRGPSHGPGCDLKLAIGRLDHALNRNEYTHL